jgi:hypothetical protein
VLVPKDVEGVEQPLGASEKKIAELRLAVWIEADDLTIEYAAATAQIAGESFAESGEALERISVSRDQPHAIRVGIKQRTETVPLNLKNPVCMREWRTGAAERQWMELG